MSIEELADKIAHSISELSEKLDKRFSELEEKIDAINTTVALHGQTLSSHDRENRQNRDEHKALEERIAKIERWMWLTIGAGAAAGVGISKLFM